MIIIWAIRNNDFNNIKREGKKMEDPRQEKEASTQLRKDNKAKKIIPVAPTDIYRPTEPPKYLLKFQKATRTSWRIANIYGLALFDTAAYSIVNNAQLLTLLEAWNVLNTDVMELSWYDWFPASTLTLLAGVGMYALTVSINQRASRANSVEKEDVDNQAKPLCLSLRQSMKTAYFDFLPPISLATLGAAGGSAIIFSNYGTIANKFGVLMSEPFIYVPAISLSLFTGVQFIKQHVASLQRVTKKGWGISPAVEARFKKAIPNPRIRYPLTVLLYCLAVLYALTGGALSAVGTYALFQLWVRVLEGTTEESYDVVASRIAWAPTFIFGIAYMVCIYSSTSLLYLDYLTNKMSELAEKGLRQFCRDNFVPNRRNWPKKVLAGVIASAILASNGQISYAALLEMSYIMIHNGPPPQPTNRHAPSNVNEWLPLPWQLGLFLVPTLNELLASHATESVETFEMLGLNEKGYEEDDVAPPLTKGYPPQLEAVEREERDFYQVLARVINQEPETLQ